MRKLLINVAVTPIALWALYVTVTCVICYWCLPLLVLSGIVLAGNNADALGL
jgi:hypothetical protein